MGPATCMRKDRTKDLRLLIRKHKSKPCQDCGKKLPYDQMSYDHCRGVKLFNLGGHINGYTRQEILDEIAKCDVVCLLCHAERERKRREKKGRK